LERCFLNERLKNIFLKNRDMRFIKMTGGLGNQMFIYAFYMRMKKHYSNTRIDLSDMVHYKAHNGYEMHRVFNLPPIEFCINQPLKKVIEFLFFKKIYERKQVPSSLVPYDKKYFWPLLYFKGFYQSERFFADMADDIRKAFTFNPSLSNRKTKEMSEQIDHDENAVSIHVRRGDYLEPKYWETTGCVCQLPYYLNAIAEYDDPALMQAALGNVAKARGMTQIAKDAGVGRESLYKSLSEDGNPSFQTIAKVIHALGGRLTIQAA